MSTEAKSQRREEQEYMKLIDRIRPETLRVNFVPDANINAFLEEAEIPATPEKIQMVRRHLSQLYSLKHHTFDVYEKIYLNPVLEKAIEIAEKEEIPFSLIVGEGDNLHGLNQVFNDTYSPDADKIIMEMMDIIKKTLAKELNVLKEDIIIIMGGDANWFYIPVLNKTEEEIQPALEVAMKNVDDFVKFIDLDRIPNPMGEPVGTGISLGVRQYKKGDSIYDSIGGAEATTYEIQERRKIQKIKSNMKKGGVANIHGSKNTKAWLQECGRIQKNEFTIIRLTLRRPGNI